MSIGKKKTKKMEKENSQSKSGRKQKKKKESSRSKIGRKYKKYAERSLDQTISGQYIIDYQQQNS